MDLIFIPITYLKILNFMSGSYNYLRSHSTFGDVTANIRAAIEGILDGHSFTLDHDAVHAEVDVYLRVLK